MTDMTELKLKLSVGLWEDMIMRVLITGTSSGIGKGIADKFLKEGYTVIGIDRREASIQHECYTHICMDIRDKTQYPELAPFDIVVNNAGVQNEEDIDVNLKGTIAITEKYGMQADITGLNFRNMLRAREESFLIQRMLRSALQSMEQPATVLISEVF